MKTIVSVLSVVAAIANDVPKHESRYIPGPIRPSSDLSIDYKIDELGVNESYIGHDSLGHKFFKKLLSSNYVQEIKQLGKDKEDYSSNYTYASLSLKVPMINLSLGAPAGGLAAKRKLKVPSLKLNCGNSDASETPSALLSARRVSVNEKMLTGNEVGASRIASYLTDGLVPQSESLDTENAIVQPKVEFDAKARKELFPAHGAGNFDFAQKWNALQREQLFSHLIVDVILRNEDARSRQFGVDMNGNIIGYDKALASIKDFDQWENEFSINKYKFELGESSEQEYIYSDFIEYLLKHKAESDRIMTSPTVTETFRRVSDWAQILNNDLSSPEFDGKMPSYVNSTEFRIGWKTFIARLNQIENQFRTYFAQ